MVNTCGEVVLVNKENSDPEKIINLFVGLVMVAADMGDKELLDDLKRMSRNVFDNAYKLLHERQTMRMN